MASQFLGPVELVRLSRCRDSDTQRHAARAIGHLAANAQCQKEIGAAGGLRPLIRCGYSRSAELQQLVVRAVANLALDPDLNSMLEAEGGTQVSPRELAPGPLCMHVCMHPRRLTGRRSNISSLSGGSCC